MATVVTRVILVAVVLAELLDLVTWMAMPKAAEVNPLAQGLHTPIAWLLKGLVVVAALGVLPALSDPAIQQPVHGHRIPAWVYAEMRDLVIVVAIYAGITGFGANVTVLAYVAAAEAPRPATQPAPVSFGTTGNEQGTQAPAAEPRTATPRGVASPLPAVAAVKPAVRSRPTPPDARVRAGTLRGRASWYAADGFVAAAGPALRRHLGRRWRGTLVRVSAGGRSVAVRLSDWCLCRGDFAERVIDLGDQAFTRLAPLSAGVLLVRVDRVRPILPPPTDTRP